MNLFGKKLKTIDRWLFRDGPPEITEATRFILVDAAEAFLRAGGAVTLDLWLELPDVCRSAFVVAGDRIRGSAKPEKPVTAEESEDETIKKALEDICKKAQERIKAGA